jgi:hypothetical protein
MIANESPSDLDGVADLPVGNAMESIADAVLKDNVHNDEQIRSDIYDNLNLLLEASHGTTSKLFDWFV